MIDNPIHSLTAFKKCESPLDDFMNKRIPQGTVQIDGDLREWSDNVYWHPLNMVFDGNPQDIETAQFALRWNEVTNKIYVAALVKDTQHVFKDIYEHWNASDRLEIYCQGDCEGGTDWQNIYDIAQQYHVAPGTSNNSWATWALGQVIGSDAGLQYAVKINGDFIVYEVAVTPFDNYGGLSGGQTVITDLVPGNVIGFDITALTRDITGGYGMLSENLMTGKSKDAGQFAKYILVKELLSE